MRVGARSLAAGLWLAAASAAAPVRASSADAEVGNTDSPERSEARVLFARGVVLMDERRFADALEAFQQAYALWENPKILLNVATALLALDRPAEAASHYVAYLESDAATPERSAEVEEILNKIRGRTARLVVNPSGGLQRIELDGIPSELSGERPLWLMPGKHVLALVYADGHRTTHAFEVKAGATITLDGAALHPPPPVAVAPTRDVDRPSRERVQEESWALTLRADIDGTGRGGVGAAGLVVPLVSSIRISGGALAGSRGGAWLGIEGAAKLGAFRPSLGASLPTFFSDATLYPGLAAELGLRYAPGWIASPFVRLGVAHFLRVPNGYVSTVAVPSVGVEVPL